MPQYKYTYIHIWWARRTCSPFFCCWILCCFTCARVGKTTSHCDIYAKANRDKSGWRWCRRYSALLCICCSLYVWFLYVQINAENQICSSRKSHTELWIFFFSSEKMNTKKYVRQRQKGIKKTRQRYIYIYTQHNATNINWNNLESRLCDWNLGGWDANIICLHRQQVLRVCLCLYVSAYGCMQWQSKTATAAAACILWVGSKLALS